MKKGKAKQNKIDDTLNLDNDLDLIDFDFDLEPPKDDRKPIIKLGAGILDGVKTGLRSTSFIRGILKDTLPKGFGLTMDLTDKVSQNVRGIYDDSVREIKPGIKDFKRVAAKLVPKDTAFIPKSVANLLKKWEEENKEYRSASKDSQREDFLSMQLTDAFKEQFVQAAKDRADESATNKLQQGLELTRHRDIFGAIDQSNQFLSRLDNYQSHVTLNYQKKTLEIHYRQLFATQDILQETRKSFALQSSSFEKIVKNTALPDFVKINNKEFRDQVFKNKFYESIQKGLFGERNDIIEKITKNVKTLVSNKVMGFVAGARAGLSNAEANEDTIRNLDTSTASSAIAGGATGAMGAKAAGYLSGKAKEYFPNAHKKIGEVGKQGEAFVGNIDRHINEFKNNKKWENDDSLLAKGIRLLQEIIPGNDVDSTLDKTNMKDLESPYVITRRTDKSLNEIIPGYLSRILREIQVFRTGDEDIELTEYDYNGGRFVSESKSLLDVKSKLLPTDGEKYTDAKVKDLLAALEPNLSKAAKKNITKVLTRGTTKVSHANIDALLTEMDPGNKLSVEFKKKLGKVLLSKAGSSASTNNALDELVSQLGGDSLSIGAKEELKKKIFTNSVNNRLASKNNLANAEDYSAENRDEISSHVSNFYDTSDRDKQNKFSVDHNNLNQNLPDPRQHMQSMFNFGQHGALEKLGLLNPDGKSLDIKKYIDYHLGISSPTLELDKAIPKKPNLNPELNTGSDDSKKLLDVNKDGFEKVSSLLEDIKKQLEENRVTISSDEDIKENFKKFSGKSALEAIKKTIISAWNYKSGEGDSGSHVGPMAQDVNENMGENAAPGGKKIDLITMNGVLMSAIQELDKQQKKILEAYKNSKIGDKVSEVSSKIKSSFGGKNIKKDEPVTPPEDNEVTNEITDIYVGNEMLPRLLAHGIKNGYYCDVFTKKIIKSIKDITGPVMDYHLNIIVTLDDIASPGLRDSKGNRLKPNISEEDMILVGTNSAIRRKIFTADGVSETNEDKINPLLGLKDIYVGDETSPRMTATKIRLQYYRDRLTNKTIFTQEDIKGEVVDKDNNVVLSFDDLKNLKQIDPITNMLKKVDIVKKIENISLFKTIKNKFIYPDGTNIFTSFKKDILDVYVGDEPYPRMTATRIRLGHYRDKVSNKIINHQSEVLGEIVDKNNNIVITMEDLDKLKFFDFKSGIYRKLKNAVKFLPIDKLNEFYRNTKDKIANIDLPDLILKGIGKTIDFFDDLKDKVNDVYVKGNTIPVMYAVKMKQGLYRDKVTNKPIYKQEDINGEVIDENNNTIISIDDIPNLVEYNPGTKRFGPIRALGRGLLSVIRPFWNFQTKIAPKMVAWNFKVLGAIAKKAGTLVGRALGIVRSKVRDVFVGDEKEPRLYATRIKLGHYRDKATLAIIEHQEDIKGEVIDGTGETILFEEDLDKLQVYNNIIRVFNPLKLVGWVAKKAIKGLKYIQSKMFDLSKFLIKTGAKAVSKITSTVWNYLSKPGDVYVKGQDKPSLFGSLMKAGKYISSKTKKLISKISDIDGDVLDENGEIVLSEDQIKLGLLNSKGQPIKPNLGEKIGNILGKINRLFSMRVALPGSRKPSALPGKKPDNAKGVANKPTGSKGKILNTPEEKTATHTEKTVSLLKDMLTVLKKKFDPKKILGDKDGDGIRENSYEDIMRKKGFLTASKDKAKEAVAEKVGANKEKPGVLGNLFNKFFGKKEQVAEDSRDYLKDIRDTLLAQSAGNALGLGGKGGKSAPGGASRASKLAKYAKWGGRALGVGGAAIGAYSAYQSIKEGDYTGAAKDAAIGVGTTLAGSAIVGGATGAMAGTGVLAGAGAGVAGTVGAVGTAGSALATLGTGIVGAVGWPVLLAAGAVALTGMAVYGGYKYFKNRSLSSLEKIRYVQYGFNKEQKEHSGKILQLEKYLMDFVVMDNGSASIKEDKFDFQKLVEPFDLDHKDPKDLEIFFEWYRKRFKSIYLTHCTALFAINKSKDLTTAEDLKDPEKKSYIDAIKFPNGPYDVTRLPIKDLGADYKCSNAKDVAAVIAEVISELKLDKIKDTKKTDVVGTATKAAIAANTTPGATTTASPGDVEYGSDRDFSDKDNKTKLPEVGISSTSSVTKNMLMGNDKATALSAVKYKAYGLVELDASKVRAIRQLESEILYTVKYNGNKLATWDGNAIDVLNKLAGLFGIGDVLGKDAGEWTYWFKNRFLPVYLGYLTGYLVLTGKISVSLDNDLIKPINQVDLAKILAGLSGIWSETKTPWPNYKLNTDSNSTKDNIEFLVSVAKDVKIEEDKKTYTPNKDSAKTDKSKVDTAKLDTPKEAGNMDIKKVSDVKTVAAPASTGAEGESKPTGGVPGVAKPSVSQPTPPIAGGERSDGSGALTAIKFKGNASLNGANASMIKLFYGMVQEYNEKTGKTVGVNSGYRSRAQQEAEYKANPAKAAKPGTSLHEKGLAIDVNSVTVDEMESLGLMKKYGFTRPIGGETWHIEPAGIQTDIKRFSNNADQASDAIKGGVGRGGGGYGTVKGANKLHRDAALAKSLLGAPVDNFMKEQLNKDIDSRANKTPIKTDKAKTGGSGIGATPVSDKSGGQSGAGGSPGASGASDTSNVVGGESKPTGSPPSGKSDLVKKEPLPSDPTVKIPDPTGSGYKGFKDLITAAAKMVGIDPAIALSTAAIESGFNPSAKAGSTGASGLFQFLKSTWDEELGRHYKKYNLDPNSNIMDPKANSIIGAQYIKTNTGILNKKVKRNIGPTEIYLSHFLGAGGATQFLTALEKDPNTDAVKLMPGPAKSNRDIFYNGGTPRTVSEVYTLLDNRIKTKAKHYGIDMSSIADTGKGAGAKDNAGAEAGTATAGATGGGGGRGSVNPESAKDTSGGTPSASGGGRGAVNPESVRDSSGGAAGRGSVNPENVRDSSGGAGGRGSVNPSTFAEASAAGRGRGSVNPNSVVDTTSEIVRNDAASSAPKVPNEVTDKSITAKPSALESVVKPSVSESINNIGKSPMSDTYGFNSSLVTKKEDVNKNTISKELFQTTEGLLGQSLEVEKQILATLKSMFGVMNSNATSKDTGSDKSTEVPPKVPQSKPYVPPRVPVPMSKTIV